MEKLTEEQAREMLLIENALLVDDDPAWRDKPQHFLRDAWRNAATLSIITEEFDLGPTDIFSYSRVWSAMLGEWLINIPGDESIDTAAPLLLDTMYAEEKWSAAQQARLEAETDLLSLVDAFVHLCSANMFNAPFFAHILHLSGYSWADVLQHMKEMNDDAQGFADAAETGEDAAASDRPH